jgi:hypothetical protein
MLSLYPFRNSTIGVVWYATYSRFPLHSLHPTPHTRMHRTVAYPISNLSNSPNGGYKEACR